LCILAGAAGILSTVARAAAEEAPAQGYVRRLDAVHDKLHLSQEQQALWDAARKKSIEVQVGVRASKIALTDLAETELERALPDLAMIARKLEEVEQHNLASERETRALWLKVYESLTPEQTAVARDAIKGALKRYRFLQNLRDRFL
jgi:hypothetical protein